MENLKKGFIVLCLCGVVGGFGVYLYLNGYYDCLGWWRDHCRQWVISPYDSQWVPLWQTISIGIAMGRGILLLLLDYE